MYGFAFQASSDGIYYLAEENSKTVYINNCSLDAYTFSVCKATAMAKIMFSHEISTIGDFENCVRNIKNGVFCSALFDQNRFKAGG